jgi:hypothetical protein
MINNRLSVCWSVSLLARSLTERAPTEHDLLGWPNYDTRARGRKTTTDCTDDTDEGMTLELSSVTSVLSVVNTPATLVQRTRMESDKLIHAELSESIIGAAMRVPENMTTCFRKF